MPHACTSYSCLLVRIENARIYISCVKPLEHCGQQSAHYCGPPGLCTGRHATMIQCTVVCTGTRGARRAGGCVAATLRLQVWGHIFVQESLSGVLCGAPWCVQDGDYTINDASQAGQGNVWHWERGKRPRAFRPIVLTSACYHCRSAS